MASSQLDDIHAQIAALQAQAAALAEREEGHKHGTREDDEKRGRVLLAGESPSPAKAKRKAEWDLGDARPRRLFQQHIAASSSSSSSSSSSRRQKEPPVPEDRLAPKQDIAGSTLDRDLALNARRLKDADARRTVVRSTSFADKPAASTQLSRQPAPGSSLLRARGNDKGKQRQLEGNTDENGDVRGDDEHHPYGAPRAQGNARNDDLTLSHEHDLQPGPKEFRPNPSDALWQTYEPNSGIRLKERVLPHAELQEHLSDRFHVPPALLYSLLRQTRGGTEYELPLEGDWVVIGVLAEKSDVRVSGAGAGNGNGSAAWNNGGNAGLSAAARMEKEKRRKEKERERNKARKEGDELGLMLGMDAQSDDELKSDGELELAAAAAAGKGKGKGKSKASGEDEGPKRQPAKYISFKLLDLRHRNAGGGSGVLNLKLFESDPLKSHTRTYKAALGEKETGRKAPFKRSGRIRVQKEQGAPESSGDDGGEDEGGVKVKHTEYKGGSGGAFEKFFSARNGTVVAILNPRIMKPWSSAMQNPENANIVSLTPDSAESMTVIGYAQDLGTCQARRKDGHLCTAWCDTRVNTVCEFHVQRAVQSKRAGRAEFFAGTGGMNTTSINSDITRLHQQPQGRGQMQGQTAPLGGYSTKGRQAARYDPASKTGLLPRDSRQSVDGLKTYVVGSSATVAPTHRMGGRALPGRTGGAAGGMRIVSAPKEQGVLDPKERARKTQREDAIMRKLLGRDGGKTLGAKYLVSNGRAGRKTENELGSGSASDSGEDAATGESGGQEVKKRQKVFDVSAVRKIGWNPASLGTETATNPKSQKNLDALALLGGEGTSATRKAPKLGRPRGEKVRSGVTVPKGHAKAGETSLRTTDDWDNLEIEGPDDFENYYDLDDGDLEAFARDNPHSENSGTSQSDDRHIVRKEMLMVGISGATAQDDEDYDLEIEPAPV